MERIVLTPWFYYDIFDNGKRIIYAPSPELKKVQRLILQKYFKPFYKQMAIKECAIPHCGKKRLLKLDILDFYNSIQEDQIKDVIHKCVVQYKSDNQTQNMEDSETEKTETEQIFSVCTINGKLPTGAPVSPYIANLVLNDFDSDIKKLCDRFNVAYSRYMDDLFFSTNEPQYILSFVELEVLKQLKQLNFEVNTEKLKYISSNKLQQVLGLGVNNTNPVLTKSDKRKYRAYFYNLIYPIQYSKNKNYQEHEKELLGHLAYIKSVDKEFYIRITFYIFNLLVKFNILKKPCLKKLVKSISYIKDD